jgi:quercetin dioxygenase-like cupin family protein
VTLDISLVPRAEWSPLPLEGCVGVEGKVLVREADFLIAMLRFPQHATIHEHPGPTDTLVVCIEGDGFTSVAGETEPLRSSERAFWPANVPHRLWTEDTTMTTLMVERPGAGFPARGLGDYAG